MASQVSSRFDGELRVVWRSIETLAPYARNARRHPRKQLLLLSTSIRRFGFVVPVLIDANGFIIAGHARVEGAKILGMTEVPTIALEHLTDAERRAYVIADNRLAQLAE
jgi:ParB-like chromosome segregation protein Spo0J